MSLLIIIALIVVVILMHEKNSDLKSENEQLKRELSKWKNPISKAKELSNNLDVENKHAKDSSIDNAHGEECQEKTVKANIFISDSEPEKTKISEKDIEREKQKKKNTLILISGAILIVLAAIVFLTSTWNTIPDIIKTGVLSALIFIFLGISVIADKKFELEQTSKAFYYIGLAYIPIVLLSISIFKLFGEYLSIVGEGRYIYFSICTIFLSALYLIESNRKNNIVLKYTSIVFQYLAVLTTTLIFSKDYKTVVSISSIISAILYFIEGYIFNNKIIAVLSMICQAIGVTFITSVFTTKIEIILLIDILYNLAITVINKKYDLKQFVELYKKYNIVGFCALTILIFGSGLINIALTNVTIINIVNFVLLLLNYYLIDLDKNEISFIKDLSILAIVLSIINIEYFSLSFELKLLIMSISVIVLYAINYISDKKLTNKIIAYLATNTLFLALFKLTGMEELYKYIPMITTFIATACEFFAKENSAKYYIVFSFVSTFIALNKSITIATFIALILSILVFMCFVKRKNLSQDYEIIPLIALVPGIYFSKIFLLSRVNFNFAIILSLFMIIYTTMRSVLNKQANISTFFSGLYILLSAICFELNMYISIILVMTWAILHAITFKNKEIFKAISYVSGLVLYNKLIADLQLPNFMIIKLLGYLVCTYLISRTILKNEKSDYKIFEYVATSIIFIYALNSYVNIVDTMIFIWLLLVLTVLGYIKKVGPLFIVSLIGIVINFLTLTEDFWHSIPWWVYLLTVGLLLMIFAIRNEIADKENKEKFKDIIKVIKEKVDM